MHVRLIKLSSPNINNIIATGCILCYLSVVLYGLDRNTVDIFDVRRVVCVLRAYTLSYGFTLAFGGLFSKTWRVYMIFSSGHKSKGAPKRVAIKDVHLFGIVGALFLVDTVLLVAWTIVDPLTPVEKQLPPERYESIDTIIYPLSEECQSDSMYTYVLIIYAYKGLLLLYGAFLAWETRKVTIAWLNDSKFIGISIYNVFILCIIGAPVIAFIDDLKNLEFALVGTFTIFATTLTLSLVFIPKAIDIGKPDEEVSVTTMGSVPSMASGGKGGADGINTGSSATDAIIATLKAQIKDKDAEITDLKSELKKAYATMNELNKKNGRNKVVPHK